MLINLCAPYDDKIYCDGDALSFEMIDDAKLKHMELTYNDYVHNWNSECKIRRIETLAFQSIEKTTHHTAHNLLHQQVANYILWYYYIFCMYML